MTALYFTEDHEWIRVDNGVATVGITNHAQEQLGDLVFVDLPEAGRALAKGDAAVVVESVKAASDVYAPVAGTVNEVNAALRDQPGLINLDPMDGGWLWKMSLADAGDLAGLMDEAAYNAMVG
ncbi:MAG: glycine cleavage system protein GcvH [Phyllobacteriaceae bacterium]|nr:glycine cleavage system protein GcvH [Phyllobacteriaceae bacterium]